MDYTQSDAYATDAGTGHRMHQDSAAVPTAWTAKDANSLVWSLMEIVTAGGQTPAQFDPAVPATFQKLKLALDSLYGQSAVVSNSRTLVVSASGFSAAINVSFDELVVQNAAKQCKTIRNGALGAFSAANTGVNGLDSGALAANTWYSVWVIYDGTNIAGLLSTSMTAPTLPAGYTYKARIGMIRTDSSGNKYPLAFTKRDRDVQYKVAAGSNVSSLMQFTSGVQSLWTSVSIASFVPACATHAFVSAWSGFNQACTQMVAPNNSYGNWASGAATSFLAVSLSAPGAGAAMYQSREILLETPQTLYVSADASGCGAAIYGWRDTV